MKCCWGELDVNSRLPQPKRVASYLESLMNPNEKYEKRIAEQTIFATKLVAEDLQDKWEHTNSSHKFFAYKGKELVAYLLMDGVPSITNVLTCEDLKLDVLGGFTSVWSDSDGKSHTVTHQPTEVEDNCFLYHPKSSYLEHTVYRGEVSMKFSMLYRTPRNPGTLRDGLHYLLERAVFDDFIWSKN